MTYLLNAEDTQMLCIFVKQFQSHVPSLGAVAPSGPNKPAFHNLLEMKLLFMRLYNRLLEYKLQGTFEDLLQAGVLKVRKYTKSRVCTPEKL